MVDNFAMQRQRLFVVHKQQAQLIALPDAFAHHSFAPHFDRSKPVSISGTVTEYEGRNPHSYLHIAAADENGLSHAGVILCCGRILSPAK